MRSRVLVAALAVMLAGGPAAPRVGAADLVPSEVWGTWFSTGPDPQANHPLTLVGYVMTVSDDWSTGATLTFDEVGGDGPSCQVSADPDNETLCTIPNPPAGTFQYVITYSGNSVVAGSISQPFDVTVSPDTVDAHAVGRSVATFYPFRDGYLDTVLISGVRDEPLSVRVRIYNSDGKRIKEITRPLDIGRYTFKWSGRTSSGAILPAGRYTVEQRLRDGAGTTKTWLASVVLSRKRLVKHTAMVTVKGSEWSSKGRTGDATVRTSDSGGYVKLNAPYPDWAGVGYQFRLPRADVYFSIRFGVYNRAFLGAPSNEIGVQDFVTCPYDRDAEWSASCFDHARAIGYGSGALRWESTGANVERNRSGRIVRGIVSVVNGPVTIYRARVKVVYGTLE